MASMLIVSFRGKKVEVPLVPGTIVLHIKEKVATEVSSSNADSSLSPHELKLMLKGKVLSDDNEDLFEKLSSSSSSKKLQKTYRLMASGLSQAEAAKANHDFQTQQRLAPRVRDDLSEAGVRDLQARQRQGQMMLQKAAAKTLGSSDSFGFAEIETLPNLPDEQQARQILESLANDPGVLACMKKHGWRVGALAELYPEGKVGESDVCVMGLNENRGQRIKLRIRTDDLRGFRKILSIRKVLFHELAHNEIGPHNQDFFILMRQIEKECNEMDWTKGAGLSSNDATGGAAATGQLYEGGTFRLGGGESDEQSSNNTDSTTAAAAATEQLSPRELALRAALQRMTAEEHEIELNCGCGRHDLFLPKSAPAVTAGGGSSDEKSTSSSGEGDDMDLS